MITLLPSRLFFKVTAILFALFPILSFGQTTYSTPGANTYTVPAGVTCITVQIWGAGGAGGSRTEGEDGGGGGGGGGYSTYIIPVTVGQVFNLSVGAGGVPVTGNNNGGAGGMSWFSSSTAYFANGGAGGTWGALTVNGTGGAGGTGNTYNGGNGGAGRNNGSGTGGGGGAAAGTTANGPNGVDGAAGAGAGGNSPLTDPQGNGGTGGAANGNGVAGQNPGGGGGGSGSDEGAGDRLGGAGGNGQIIVTPNAAGICASYCTPAFPSGTYPISNVTFNTINNTTSAAVGGPAFQDFTGTCTSVTQGQSYNLSVTATGAGAPNTFYLQAYFDWNLDGDFSDANESSAIGSYTAASSGVMTVPITIPCNAIAGRSIQMRIVNHFSTIGLACETAGYGQAEYYCLTIVAATAPTANAGPDQNLNCLSGATLNSTLSNPATGFWELISGSGTITTPTSQTSTVTGLGNGANVFQWTATGTCANATDQVTITAAGLPTTPAYAGLDMSSCQASLVLSGSDPSPGTGLWTVVGPNTPTFTPSATDPGATISGMINGTYTFTWSVTIPGCAAYTDAMTLMYGTLPTPNAGVDQTICPTGTAISATGFEGLTGTWSAVSGPNTPGFADASSASTNTYGMVAGAYVIRYCLSGGGCPGSTCDNVAIQVNACTTPVTHSTTTNQTFTGCSYTYTDNGGAGGNYANGISQTETTFCPDNPNAYATLTVTAANFAPGDYMVIYDDDQPASPIVAAYYYDPSPGGGMVFSPALNTTITSSTGCLIVQMNSNSATNTTGWTANVGCSLTQGVQNQSFVTVNNCGAGGGITLCASGTVVAVANQTTNPPDLGNANSGCLGSQEGASNTWVYMVAATTGWIAFQIAPAGGQDFDYAIWGPYDGGYACPGNSLDDPIRCSWAANGGAGCPATIGIGAQNSSGAAVGAGDVSEGGTCSATNEGWTYPIFANAGDVYVVLFQNYSYNNSSFDFTVNNDPSKLPAGGSFASLGCTPPTPLPVELISFVGESKNRKNYLYWHTASENSNDFFTIERSNDGENWSILTNVDGAGFSQEMRSYSTVDEQPYFGVTYYRLNQTDFNGESRTYKTIAITNDLDIETLFSDIYPNPTSGSFFFNYAGKDLETEIVVNVISSSGQVVRSQTFTSFNESQSLSIDCYDLAAGIYKVEFIQNGKREIKKLTLF